MRRKWLKSSVLYVIIHSMDRSINARPFSGGILNRNRAPLRKGSAMIQTLKRSLLFALILLLVASLFGCAKKPEVTYVDTLPSDQANGFSWVARAGSDDTGQVYIGQTYRDDETYAFMGASGVLKTLLQVLCPASRPFDCITSTRWIGTAPTAAQKARRIMNLWSMKI